MLESRKSVQILLPSFLFVDFYFDLFCNPSNEGHKWNITVTNNLQTNYKQRNALLNYLEYLD